MVTQESTIYTNTNRRGPSLLVVPSRFGLRSLSRAAHLSTTWYLLAAAAAVTCGLDRPKRLSRIVSSIQPAKKGQNQLSQVGVVCPVCGACWGTKHTGKPAALLAGYDTYQGCLAEGGLDLPNGRVIGLPKNAIDNRVIAIICTAARHELVGPTTANAFPMILYVYQVVGKFSVVLRLFRPPLAVSPVAAKPDSSARRVSFSSLPI